MNPARPPGHGTNVDDAEETNRPPAPGSEATFTAMRAAFRQVADARPSALCESHHVFGGHEVRIRTVSRRLAECVTAPFAHLTIPGSTPSAPRLTIDLWDEEETQIPCPVTAVDAGRLDEWKVGRGTFTLSSDRRFAGFRFRQSFTCIDRKTQHIVGCVASSRELTLYERGKPLHLLLTLWYADRNIQLVHTGLVARNGQGVLLPGRERAGKSTSALACLAAGLEYIGDDYVGVQALGPGKFVGHSVFGSTWLEPTQLARFPRLAAHTFQGRHPWETKSLVLLPPLFPGRLRQRASIRVLALPRIVDAEVTRIRPASKAETLLEIMPSSLLQQLLRPGAAGFRRLVELVESVPTYWLELGRDLEGIPPAVEALLREATGS